MFEIPKAASVHLLDNYQIEVVYSNGDIARQDFLELIDKEPFKKLKNKEFFQQVQLIGNQICWPEELDFCADAIWFRAYPKKYEKWLQSIQQIGSQ